MNEPLSELAAVGVVDDVLADRLPEALRERAVELALDDRVIEDVAAVVDRGVARDRHLAGVAVDLDLGDMAAVGEGLRRLGGGLGVEVFRDLAALLHLLGARRQLEQRDPPVGADHLEAAVLVGDVGFGGFEHVRPRSSCPWPAWCRWS